MYKFSIITIIWISSQKSQVWGSYVVLSSILIIPSYPRSLALLKRSRDNIKDPLFRFFDREVKLGAAILKLVRADLRELEEICSGEKRQTNHHR